MKRSSVTTLPADVLDELNRRILASSFSDYVGHSAWLQQQGYSVSKSAIHRYATEHASDLLASERIDSSLSAPEAKLRCLEVVATLGVADSSDTAIEHAESLLRWVYSHP
ncbi:phage protein Gp27 family protein [Thauera butanivorans]|uniref:phage protein Gp27 family protein n=1 Tax=Thauera butanivorans TaxID=86174 RepID=UPI003AB15EB8